MLSYHLVAREGIAGLRLENAKENPMGSADLKLKMKAATLNYRDQLTIEGTFYDQTALPFIPVSDGVGEIVDVGADVSGFKTGMRVAPIFDQDWLDGSIPEPKSSLGGDVDGVLTQEMIVPAKAVVKIPDYLSDVEAASLPCAAVTAWNALMTEHPLKQDEFVLIQGTGSVSLFVLQFAAAKGAKPIVLSSSDEKLTRAKKMGAFATLNYKTDPDWENKIASITDNHGIDVTVDVTGGENLQKSIMLATLGGRISSVGILSDFNSDVFLPPIFLKEVKLRGIRVGSKAMFESMLVFMEQHKIKPVTDSVYAFENAIQAFEHQKNGDAFGKIAIEIP